MITIFQISAACCHVLFDLSALATTFRRVLRTEIPQCGTSVSSVSVILCVGPRSMSGRDTGENDSKEEGSKSLPWYRGDKHREGFTIQHGWPDEKEFAGLIYINTFASLGRTYCGRNPSLILSEHECFAGISHASIPFWM